MKYILVFLCALTLSACQNNSEIGNAKDVDPETIYYDYKISAEEGRENVTVMLQYRFGGEDGTTLVLEEPSKVKLDGVELEADSTKFSGAFYELIKPAKEFKGPHTIVFTDRDKKEHKENFNFKPFTLSAELPEKIKMAPFTVKLNGLPASPSQIHLVITDTSFYTLDVSEEMIIEHGEIKIGQQQLKNLVPGPVTLKIYREEERPLKNGSKEGGRILMTYSLERQFEFVE